MSCSREPLPSVSVIVPTLREVLNLPPLLRRIAEVRAGHDLDLDVWVMDDDSRDGSADAVAQLELSWVQFVARSHDHGLARAALDGMRRARRDVVLIMDADLSHPPEAIVAMLRELQRGARAVIGSRYIEGGSTDAQWGWARWINSRIATLLARPLTDLADPMAGLFAMWRRDLDGAELDPVGYKIVLELIVKCGLSDVHEIPIHFVERRLGASKLTLRQQLLYLAHLRRLYAFRLRR